jgi:hypothetical protein
VGAGGQEGGEAMGGTGTKKDMVMLEADEDRASSCGKECSIKLDTPRDCATDVGTWGEQKWMGGTETPPPWMKEGTLGGMPPGMVKARQCLAADANKEKLPPRGWGA